MRDNQIEMCTAPMEVRAMFNEQSVSLPAYFEDQMHLCVDLMGNWKGKEHVVDVANCILPAQQQKELARTTTGPYMLGNELAHGEIGWKSCNQDLAVARSVVNKDFDRCIVASDGETITTPKRSSKLYGNLLVLKSTRGDFEVLL